MKIKAFIVLLIVSACAFIAGWQNAYDDTLLEEVEEETGIVPYARWFRQYAPQIGWDWETLAAVAYHESRFNSQACSSQGAKGLMQIMPRTAARYGLNDSTIMVPKDNIEASAKFFSFLQRQFAFVGDSTEQTKFVLAAYNAGPAHIHDARRLARKYGANPYRWEDVEVYMMKLSEEEYYTDSVVLFGAFNAWETQRYVRGVMHTRARLIKESKQAQ